MEFLKKRQLSVALFLFLSGGVYSHEACKAQGEFEQSRVKTVIDGDTLHLSDGRKVRLVGINTPELDHQNGQHDAYAVAATKALESLAGDAVLYQPARDSRDRYGRHLYYLFDQNGVSISSQLLSLGLGYRVAIPPNLKYQTCFQYAERQARQAKKGVWDKVPEWQPKGGFTISTFTITSVTRNRGGWWLETERDLVINIPFKLSEYWPAQKVYYLEGKTVEARGWQHFRKSRNPDYKSWYLSVKHPNDLQLLHK
ncbi:thermonuclease family protein [Marinomonas sp. C2222]|uniref:Thermonuclease family protein n=1 Tax=Marinomonas sargassi TaxID=2984494 RepID=A0ABT2YVU5_9GAMM|nr:thermonuclease family protein [Marinomonas sargassi]MCV2403983.1 thermonuclease family protein [Marinomonas sargassi]